jgi:hypothetical protein
VPVARDVELAALTHEGELEIAGRAVLAGEQRLELARAAANGIAGARLVALFRMGQLHGFLPLIAMLLGGSVPCPQSRARFRR